MNKKHSLEGRFIYRLEHTKDIFGYISLEAIVNGQLKQKIRYNILNLKRINNCNSIERKRYPVPKPFRKVLTRSSTASS